MVCTFIKQCLEQLLQLRCSHTYSVALAVAAIEAVSCENGHQCEDWRGLVAHLLISLRRCCLDNPNHRKAFAAVAGHLLVAILQSAFREGIFSAA